MDAAGEVERKLIRPDDLCRAQHTWLCPSLQGLFAREVDYDLARFAGDIGDFNCISITLSQLAE